MNRIISVVLLILALLFSHFLILNFNLNGGFESKGIGFQPLPLIAFSGQVSNNKVLSSSIIGYILFTIFLFANFNRAKAATPILFYSVLFLSIISILFELYCFYLDYNNSYTGQRLRIGFVLYFICFYYIFRTINRSETQTIKKSS
jgi:hypothetical protein